MRYNNFAMKLVTLLPPKLIYACTIQLIAEATTGKYSNTLVPELKAMDAVARYSRKHALGGSGKDEHYDSNRYRK